MEERFILHFPPTNVVSSDDDISHKQHRDEAGDQQADIGPREVLDEGRGDEGPIIKSIVFGLE